MTFIRIKACRTSTTTHRLNCFWQSARKAAAQYRRFATAAEANRYAVENLRTPKAFGAWLEVGDERLDSSEIHRLYEAMTIRYASPGDGALARLRNEIGVPLRRPISGKRHPPPTSKESLKGPRLRIILARVV